MAGLPQIGDLVRLCELGFLVWDLGWSAANNASELSLLCFDVIYLRDATSVGTFTTVADHVYFQS